MDTVVYRDGASSWVPRERIFLATFMLKIYKFYEYFYVNLLVNKLKNCKKWIYSDFYSKIHKVEKNHQHFFIIYS